MKDILLSLLLQDLPESLLSTLVCFSFLRLRWDWKRITVITFLMTLTNLVRLLPIAFGVHSLVLIFFLALYLNLFTKVRMSKTLSAAIFCLVIVAATQMLYLPPFLKITGYTMEQILASPLLRCVASLPYFVILLVVALLIQRNNHKKNRFID